MKVMIEVTAEDVANGMRCDCSLCPVALAARRAMADALVGVGVRSIFLGGPHERKRVELPDEVREKIVAYDREGVMEPFSFELEA